MFSGLETYEFLWRATPGAADGVVGLTGQNHDASHRPRPQDREPDYRETGAFYVMAAAGLRTHGHRFFGRTAVVPVSERSAIEIDTVEELEVADSIARATEPVDPPGGSDVCRSRWRRAPTTRPTWCVAGVPTRGWM